MQRQDGHGVETAVFLGGFVEHALGVGLGHGVGEIAVLRDAVFAPAPAVRLDVVAAPVLLGEHVALRPRMPDRGEGTGEHEAAQRPALARGFEDVLHLGEAAVVDLLRRLAVVADRRAGVDHRAAAVEGGVVAAPLEEVAGVQRNAAAQPGLVQRREVVHLLRPIQVAHAGAHFVALFDAIAHDPRTDVAAGAGHGDRAGAGRDCLGHASSFS